MANFKTNALAVPKFKKKKLKEKVNNCENEHREMAVFMDDFPQKTIATK